MGEFLMAHRCVRPSPVAIGGVGAEEATVEAPSCADRMADAAMNGRRALPRARHCMRARAPASIAMARKQGRWSCRRDPESEAA